MTQFFAKKLNKKGFTLAELLIVVAIIAVLVAVAIPIFNNSLMRARYGVHNSNGRALKSLAVAELLTSEEFAGKPISDGAKFVALGSYDFASEKFVLSKVSPTTTGQAIGMWCQTAAEFTLYGDGSLSGLSSTNVYKFDGSSASLKNIGSLGTGSKAAKVYYAIVFTGIDVQSGVVSYPT